MPYRYSTNHMCVLYINNANFILCSVRILKVDNYSASRKAVIRYNTRYVYGIVYDIIVELIDKGYFENGRSIITKSRLSDVFWFEVWLIFHKIGGGY